MTDAILEISDLRKTFHANGGSEIHAVSGISPSVERGEIFGFLGPNGAGKSTTITMLTTGLRPDWGEILLDGRSVIRHPEEAHLTERHDLDIFIYDNVICDWSCRQGSHGFNYLRRVESFVGPACFLFSPEESSR